jgi:hypothetical protein
LSATCSACSEVDLASGAFHLLPQFETPGCAAVIVHNPVEYDEAKSPDCSTDILPQFNHIGGAGYLKPTLEVTQASPSPGCSQ